MATKKTAKAKVSEKVKKLLLAECKRFKNMIEKYLPDNKDRKEIVKKFDEVYASVEKALG